jgi:hypothetical protein
MQLVISSLVSVGMGHFDLAQPALPVLPSLPVPVLIENNQIYRYNIDI